MVAFRTSVVLLMFLAAGGCDLFARMMPEKVGDGISRLTVRNAATLMQAVEADANCGFASEIVKKNAVVEGPVGLEGTVKWQVKNCVIDFGSQKLVATDCQGKKTFASGKVSVNATRQVTGRLTGNAETPVVPQMPDAVHIELQVTFDNFSVNVEGDSNALTQISGVLTVAAEPHLAVSKQKGFEGICMIPTSDVTLRKISYDTDSMVQLATNGMAFQVPVKKSQFYAQAGIWNGEQNENQLLGQIHIWDQLIQVPTDNRGLDPSYERDEFRNSYSCREGLDGDVSYLCSSLKQKLARGVAPLSALVMGQMATSIDYDYNCGFSNPGVISEAALSGYHGYAGGKAVFNIKQPCQMRFEKKIEVNRDCHGVIRYASGTVRVSGKKTMKGILGLDPMSLQDKIPQYEGVLSTAGLTLEQKTSLRPEPIVPNSWEAAALDLDVEFDDFTLVDECSKEGDLEHPWHCSRQERFRRDKTKPVGFDNLQTGPVFSIKSGRLSGRVTPRLALNDDPQSPDYGLCSQRVSVATLESLKFTDATARIALDGHQFQFDINDSLINAFNGKQEKLTNAMTGYVVLDQERIDMAPEGQWTALDPDYDEARQAHSFLSCGPKKRMVESAGECSGQKMVGENAARLIIQNLGGVLKMSNQNTLSCGFQSVGTLMSPKVEMGTKGESSARYSVKDCQIGEGHLARPIMKQDKGALYAGGYAVATGSMTMVGDLVSDSTFAIHRVLKAGWDRYWGGAPKVNVNMIRPDALTFSLDQIHFDDFFTMQRSNEPGQPMVRLIIHEGTLSANVSPFLQDSTKEPGSFYKEGSVFTFSNVVLRDAAVTLEANGLLFRFQIPQTNLFARAGDIQGIGNYLRGSIQIDGQTIDIGSIPLVPKWNR